jgi:hypothetical protein
MTAREFEHRMLLARLRWLLTDEARRIALRLEQDGALTAENLAPMLMLAVTRVRPRSRLVPWHLSNAIVERMVGVVANTLISESELDAS